MAHPMKAQAPEGAASGATAPAQIPSIALAGAWEDRLPGRGENRPRSAPAGVPAAVALVRRQGAPIRSTVLTEAVRFPYDASVAYWAFVAVAYGEGEPETYVLPLTMAVGPHAAEVQQRVPPGRARPGAAA